MSNLSPLSHRLHWAAIALMILGVGGSVHAESALLEQPVQAKSWPAIPPKIYVVPGVPITIYYANLLLRQDLSKLCFDTHCAIGHAESYGWVLDGEDIVPGTYPITFKVTDEAGAVLNRTSEVVVTNPITRKQPLLLLIVGDSLTHASHYPNRIAEHLNRNTELRWQMIGTHKPPAAAKRVQHEGYGGKTWEWFLKHYESEPDGTHRKRSSPFVFLQDDGLPKIDLEEYFQQASGGKKPDLIVILLGINDCFTASANPGELGPKKIDTMLENADRLIEQFQKACPDAKIGIGVTPPPNRRSEAFVACYQEKYPRQGWLQVLQRIQKEQIRKWGHSENGQVSLIPIHLNLDTAAGFPENNAVHPNRLGYQQIGDSIYAWISATP